MLSIELLPLLLLHCAVFLVDFFSDSAARPAEWRVLNGFVEELHGMVGWESAHG